MEQVGIGIIGCGNISGAYLKAMTSAFPILDIRGLADLNRDLAEAKAAECNLQARTAEELFADPKVEIRVEGAREAVVAAVRAAPVGVDRPAEGDTALGRDAIERRFARILEVLGSCHGALQYRTYVRCFVRP